VDEHVERQEEREAELKSDTDRLEQQGDELEQHGDRLEQEIGSAREDFEQKKQSADVPGAQEEETHMTESQGSDVDPRPGTSETPGAADDEGQATGNPPNDDSEAADDDS
jgi:septal ring factor EnvC (AmiA/AmiB activator)